MVIWLLKYYFYKVKSINASFAISLVDCNSLALKTLLEEEFNLNSKWLTSEMDVELNY